jgi:hypothetical protein
VALLLLDKVMMVVVHLLLVDITVLVEEAVAVLARLVLMVFQALAHQIIKQAVMVALVYHRP